MAGTPLPFTCRAPTCSQWWRTVMEPSPTASAPAPAPPPQTLPPIFVCIICRFHFKSEVSVKQHVKVAHDQWCSSYKCAGCAQHFQTREQLYEHVHHICGFKWGCKCGRFFETEQELLRHCKKEGHGRISVNWERRGKFLFDSSCSLTFAFVFSTPINTI